MTAVIMKDSPTTPYDALHRRILVSLRDVPTRALLWIFILGASVNLLLSAALRLMSNDRRLFFPYSTTLLASSVAPALIALLLGESAASRELAKRYAGSTGKDVWRAHTSTARQILAMGIPYALVCAGCELVISGGNADPANIWSSFPSPIRWALLPVIVILSYYLGASIGAIKLRHPTCSTLIRIFVGIVFFIGIQAYGVPLILLRFWLPIVSPELPSLPSLTVFSVQFIVAVLILGVITCRQLILRTSPLR